MESYSGVDTPIPIHPGLQSYSRDIGLKDGTLQLTTCHQISDLWSIETRVGYAGLADNMGNSPTLSNNSIEDL